MSQLAVGILQTALDIAVQRTNPDAHRATAEVIIVHFPILIRRRGIDADEALEALMQGRPPRTREERMASASQHARNKSTNARTAPSPFELARRRLAGWCREDSRHRIWRELEAVIRDPIVTTADDVKAAQNIFFPRKRAHETPQNVSEEDYAASLGITLEAAAPASLYLSPSFARGWAHTHA